MSRRYVSLDCMDGVHDACAADGGCSHCHCHRTRPTTAQLATGSDLSGLIAQAEAAQPLAITVADLDTLREVIQSTRALLPLVDRDESWVEPARAHTSVAVPLVAAIRRRGEER